MAYLDDLLADPVEAVSRRRRERSTKSYTAPLTPQQQIGVLNHIGHGTISGLSAIGNVLDLPGSSVRDIVGGENPFDQWIPTNWASSENRLTGRDLARRWGMAGSQDNWGNWTGGLGLEIGLDPLTYLGGAGFAKTAVGKAGKIFGLADDAARGLSVAGRSVGRAEGLARGTLGDAIVAARNPTQATLRNSPGIRLTKPFDEAKKIARVVRYGGEPGKGALPRALGREARQTGPRISEALAEPLGTGWTAHLPFYGQLDLAGLGARVGMPNLGRGAASQAFARGKDTIWDAFRSTAPIRHVRQMFDSRVMSTTEPYAQKLAEDFHSRFGPAQAAAAMTQHDALASVEDIFKEFMTTYRPAFKASGRTTNQASLDALTTFNDMLRHGMETGERSQMLDILHDRVGLAYANRAPGTQVLDSMLAAGNRIKQWKDRGTNEVQRMGGNMTFMGGLEEGFMSQHFPRSVNPEFAKQYGHRIVNTISNRVLKQRDEAVRYVPTEILNRMLGDTSLRDAINRGTGADRIRQHSVYGRFLDASDPVKHSQDVANWLSGRGRGRLYNEDPFKDLLSYQRGMEIYKSSLRAVHHQLINNAFDPGKLPGGGTTLKKVFEDANMNPDTAMEFFRDISGNKTRSLDDISKMLVPNDVADAIKTVLHPQHFPKFMEQSLGVVDRMNGLFKNSVTVLAPLGIPLFASFFNRNLLSGQFANIAFLGLNNTKDLGAYVRGIGKSISAIGDARKLQNRLNAGQGVRMTLAQAMDRDPEMVNMVVHGVLGHKVGFEGVEQALREGAAPQWPWDFKATMEEVLGKHGPMPSKALHGEIVRGWVARGVPQAEAVRRADQAIQKPIIEMLPGGRGIRAGFHHAAATGGKINQWVEYFNRAPMYHYYRSKGYTPARAAYEVKARQFDYSDLSEFEKGVMKRVVPFYTFSRKMFGLMFDTLTERPGGALGQTIRASRLAHGGSGLTPDYVQETTAIPVSGPLESIFGSAPEGTDRFITGFGLGHEDPASFLSYNPRSPIGGTLRTFGLEALSRTAPWLKGPLEWSTNQTFFQRGPGGGRSLEDLDPTINRTIANVSDLLTGDRTYRAPEYLSPGSEFILANSPASRVFTTARTLSDPRKSAGAKAWNMLTGLRLSDVSEAAKDAILREKAQDIMTETGAHSFQRTYYSQEQLDKMTPEQQQNAIMLQLLMNWLADRSKQRKESREAAKKKPPGIGLGF